MLFPALSEAAKDKALGEPALRVYLHLVEVLGFGEFAAVKQSALAREVKLSESAIRKGMKRLVDRGYLDKGPVKPGEARTYALLFKRKVKAA